MKKFFVVFLTVVYLGLAAAQVSIDKPYAGAFFGGSFLNTDRISYTNTATMRLASEIDLRAAHNLWFKSEVAMEIAYDSSLTGSVLSKLYVEYDHLVDVLAGKVARPFAQFFRPSPIGVGSQFEPPSKSATGIGSALGGKLVYHDGDNRWQLGIFYDEERKQWSKDIGAQVDLAGWTFGVAGTSVDTCMVAGMQLKRTGACEIFLSGDNVSLLTLMTELQFDWGFPYLDLVADHQQRSLTGVEVGVTRTFAYDTYEILVGVGFRTDYSHSGIGRDEMFNVYVYIHTP